MRVDEINIEGIDTNTPEKPASDSKALKNFSDCYLSDEESDQEDNLPAKKSVPKEDDDYDILDDMLSDSDYTTIDPVPEQHSIPKQQSESPAE
ncbi:hypothetical protein GLOIN_2v1875323 [Rhizophagus irregularis DAOM 181602=DAOM 197198]|nr:hypothetical protein GLOIN_2v1875323 [Rhizophagus irregularis DAOM 181602=DAOM 197198]